MNYKQQILDRFRKRYFKVNGWILDGKNGAEVESFLSNSLDEMEKNWKKDLRQELMKYACDLNWDFEKNKAKHKSYIALEDILSLLSPQEVKKKKTENVMPHRNYIFPPYSTLQANAKTGTSDSYKKGHSVLYVYCTCDIGKDHETGTCPYCQQEGENET